MTDEYTPAVVRALEAAQARAAQADANEVTPLHLAQGLLQETEGQAAVRAAQAGLDLPALLAAWPPAPAPLPADGPALPLSREAQAVLDRARDLSADPSISSELVLLALVLESDAVRQDWEARGLRLADLRAQIQAGQGPPLRLDEPLHLVELPEQLDTARILDACANRAREALRVLEDYQRFVLNDAVLSGELKGLRHALTEALADLPPRLLLTARETLRDVGTALTTEQEQQRFSLAHVAQANLKRLQEALRSLEEFGKLHSPRLGQQLEQLRYRSYTLEKALLRGGESRQRLADARLYVLLTGAQCAGALDWTIAEAAAGGAAVFQLREKTLTDRELLERARRVRCWTRDAGVLFIVNDRPDIARLVEADGVHIGQEELPVHEVRRLVGPDALIGVSTHNPEQVRQAVLDGADYIGVGPTFPSGTKNFTEFPGLDFVRQAAALTSLPAFVIGGITRDNLPVAVAAGARRIAVSQAVCAADEPRQAAADLLRLLAVGLSGTDPDRQVR
jgi:thiamine-phosphate pyrophosphorylase